MCFSASASFGAAIVLTAAGIASTKKITQPKQLLFASIPLLFAMQQFTEGFLWLSLTNSSFALFERTATNFFLAFAQVIWPIWVPLSIMLFTNEVKKRTILSGITLVGISIASYLLYCLFAFPVSAKIVDHHITYQLYFPSASTVYTGIPYFIATVIPSFLIRIPKMRYLAYTILASFLFTTIFYKQNFISVWCFFAAITSVIIWSIMVDTQKEPQQVTGIKL